MPPLWVIALSIISYASLVIFLYLFRHQIHFLFTWPTTPITRRMWIMWLLFLAIFAPLSEYPGDMQTWVDGVRYMAAGRQLPFWYVYLPIYSQFMAGLWLPFSVLNPVSAKVVLLYQIHALVLFAYAYSSTMLSRLAPDQREIATLAIIFNPVLLLNVFQGQNHLLMLACLLAALWMIWRERWFWAGFWVALGCYKFMLIPSAAVLTLIVLHRYGWKKLIPYFAGVLMTLIPSAIYYAYYPQRLLEIVSRFGSVGGHAYLIERYHFLFFVSNRIPGFNTFYLEHHIWVIIVVAGAVISAFLYWRGKLNSLQALGITEAIVCLAAPESFHLEPMIGLLWLDATRRRDLSLQTAVFATILLFSAAWYPDLNWDFESGALQLLMFLWEPRGLVVGAAVISVIVLTVRGGAPEAEVLEGEYA
jgi:hypothetical protein